MADAPEHGRSPPDVACRDRAGLAAGARDEVCGRSSSSAWCWRCRGRRCARSTRATSARALHALDPRWLRVARSSPSPTSRVMGLYDVIAFRHTRSRWTERWRYGAVAFAWSNFLTLGPLAGPAMRFWLYRPAVEQLADLHAGVVVDRDRVHVGAGRLDAVGRWLARCTGSGVPSASLVAAGARAARSIAGSRAR